MRQRLGLLAVATATAVLLAGCGSSAQPKPTVSDVWKQEVAWGECDRQLLADRGSFDPGFKAADVQCAEIAVPVDYAKPKGEQLTLTLMKDPASGSADEYQGALFSNPGGPGQSGIQYIQTAAMPQSLRDSYDVIGFDPRGVGASSPIRCSDELDLRSYFEWPFDVKNQAEADAARQAELEYYRDCEQRNPYWWAVSSAQVVQDIELMRKLLTGDAPLNFVGHSYGTVLAARYITEFPEHVGRIVLDSPVTQDQESLAARIASAKAGAAARERIFAACAQDPTCYGDTVRQVEDHLIWARDEVLAGRMQGQVAAMRPEGFFKSGNGTSAYLILHAIDLLAYWPLEDAYTTFKQIYSALDQYDYSGFEWLGLAQDGYDLENDLARDNSYEILNIVNCLDRDNRDTRSAAVIEQERKKYEAADPFSLRFHSVYDFEPAPADRPGCYWSWRAYDEPKIADPPKKSPPFSNESGKEAVVIGSMGDNVTPFEWSTEVARTLKSPLIAYGGTGHAQLWNGISCIDDPVLKFLLTGQVPETQACSGR